MPIFHSPRRAFKISKDSLRWANYNCWLAHARNLQIRHGGCELCNYYLNVYIVRLPHLAGESKLSRRNTLTN